MASGGARRVEVPDEIRARPGQPGPGYASAFELAIGAKRFEGAPALLRVFLTTGWRYGLGLKLGARASPEHVLGWLISSSGSDSITLEARSRLMVAQNIVVVSESTVVLATLVQFSGRTGRALWAVATPVHQRVIPYLLQRAWN
jgi:Protein of unknown function (DUF2867)